MRNKFLEMKNDAYVLANSSSVGGIERTSKRGDLVDPLDGSTAGQWKERLTNAFLSLATIRDHYTQIRFIGIADEGRELVRVNRVAGKLRVVEENALQQKVCEPYMQRLLSHSTKSPFFSEVTFNRENNAVGEPKVPTIRCVVPTYFGNRLFGAIVINADYAGWLQEAIEVANVNRSMYVVDSNENYLVYHPGTRGIGFAFHQSGDYVGSKVVKRLHTLSKPLTILADDKMFFCYKLVQDFSDHESMGIGVIIGIGVDQLLATPRRLNQVMIGVASLLVAMSVVVAIVLGSRLTRPLREMSIELNKLAGNPHASISLPTTQPDEIGLLATTFTETLNSLRDSQSEAMELIGRLEASNRELDEFAYVASHDLKAPLRVIENATQWLIEDLSGLDADSLENLKLVRSRAVRMESLLDDLLTFSRIGRLYTDGYTEQIRADELVNEIASLVSPPSGIEVRVCKDLHDISVKRMPLEQVLLNLVSNSVKHHDKDTGTVEVRAFQDEHEITFEVEDDGPGIPEKYRSKVFKMFQTLKPRDQIEGSGMGLAIVEKHIRTIGGAIELETGKLGGCLFRIHWPKCVEEGIHKQGFKLCDPQ
ncbi:sensor histidine kinase [Rhodopirellula sp. MGV]|uniref:sensor histidine kinase n=1 Tax=Rhodopirellula sp. MGV TaxID=2023130 RepID=UPI00117BBE67|nr:HAMP domain-containing sensor histidine kinase [Rhodopirellula sp. MGV]